MSPAWLSSLPGMSDAGEQLNLFDISKDFPQPSADRVRQVESTVITIARSSGLGVRSIRWKNNRRVMASIGKGGVLNLHVIYQRAEEEDLVALANVLNGNARAQDRGRFERFIESYLPRELGEGKSRLIVLPPKGLFHDLNRALATVLPLLDEPLNPMPQVGWSKVRVGRRGITWGTHRDTTDGPLVMVNAVLDAPDAPNCVVEHIVWHELCHQAAPPENGSNNRRKVHSPAFRNLENKYPRRKEAEDWLQENVARLIKRYIKQR